MKVYVASSWRNTTQPEVVAALRAAGHEVYDFRHPAPGNEGFHWSEIDPEWKGWTPEDFIELLGHPVAERGFGFDMAALDGADATVCVLPCGRSVHLEAGYTAGQGKPVIFLLQGQLEPELMYKMGRWCVTTIEGAVVALAEIEAMWAPASPSYVSGVDMAAPEPAGGDNEVLKVSRACALTLLDKWKASMDDPEHQPPIEVHHIDLAVLRSAIGNKAWPKLFTAQDLQGAFFAWLDRGAPGTTKIIINDRNATWAALAAQLDGKAPEPVATIRPPASLVAGLHEVHEQIVAEVAAGTRPACDTRLEIGPEDCERCPHRPEGEGLFCEGRINKTAAPRS
ncbi:MAG TPA: hypothetical protein VD969_19630 [Symbiobacteriaceae bacterium]|nr:hypothetical protein [Symbiobacteriaceae bacterium]